MNLDTLDISPDFPHRVAVKINGFIMDEEAQEQRDAMAEWFLRSEVKEEDMDSAFFNVEPNKRWGMGYTHMAFGFRDPQKAILFKLAWG